jgi:hypothetical protein
MSQRFSLGLATVMGFAGGILAAHVSPPYVRAQESTQNHEGTVIRAERFVLVNDHGMTEGTIGFDSNGRPEITLFDPEGKIVWSTKTRAVPVTR